ncbi:SMI1/KNR4 family protein [Streptomyces canus]|uniref:SMI1/KNR4 family protein n=1 Tax=Streptomyces canus TaxID=58343 RepID=UPI0030DDE118
MNAALARLTQLITPPSEPRTTDWDAVQEQLGVTLPTDYKDLIHAYGGSNWDDYLYLLEPGCPNDNYDLIEWEDQQTEALEGLWEFEKKPDELADASSRVIPWAHHRQRRMPLLAREAGPDPEQWTVMVNEARGDRWEHYPMTCTESLLAALEGDVQSDILSSRFPLTTHDYRQLTAV